MQKIAYALILGKPLIFYLGILTIISFFLTALIGYLNHNGNHKIPLKWHFRLAGLSLALAVIHALMGILSYV